MADKHVAKTVRRDCDVSTRVQTQRNLQPIACQECVEYGLVVIGADQGVRPLRNHTTLKLQKLSLLASAIHEQRPGPIALPQRLRVPGVMFMSLQMSKAGRPPSCCWTARIRASFGWCSCAMLGCSGVFGLGCKHPLRTAFNWTKKRHHPTRPKRTSGNYIQAKGIRSDVTCN